MPSAIALVTGATSGIGRATAFALGRAGYRVGVCARTPARVDGLLGDLRAEGIDAPAEPHATMATNLRSLYLVTREVLPGMRARRSGLLGFTLTPALENILGPEDVAQTILDAIRMPPRALVSEIDIRPANP